MAQQQQQTPAIPRRQPAGVRPPGGELGGDFEQPKPGGKVPVSAETSNNAKRIIVGVSILLGILVGYFLLTTEIMPRIGGTSQSTSASVTPAAQNNASGAQATLAPAQVFVSTATSCPDLGDAPQVCNFSDPQHHVYWMWMGATAGNYPCIDPLPHNGSYNLYIGDLNGSSAQEWAPGGTFKGNYVGFQAANDNPPQVSYKSVNSPDDCPTHL